VKRSGRDESMWVVIHMCMEAMIGISPYSYLYLKLAKMSCLSYYYLLCFLFNTIGEEGRTGSAWKRGGWGQEGKVAQTMYTYMNKCTNNLKKGSLTQQATNYKGKN
jgi:hypothetical protein